AFVLPGGCSPLTPKPPCCLRIGFLPSLFCRKRQTDRKTAPVVQPGDEADGPAVCLDEALADGQAQSATAGPTGAGLVHTEEPLKDSRLVLLSNAAARVGHGQDRLTCFGSQGPRCHAAALRRA